MWEGSSRISILGILLARTASGLLSDLAGWRSAYAVSAAITFAQLLALLRLVPNDARSGVEMRYTALVASIVRLFQTNRALHSRATQGFLIFTAITLLWTPMVLRCAPHSSRFLTSGARLRLLPVARLGNRGRVRRAGQHRDRRSPACLSSHDRRGDDQAADVHHHRRP